MTTNPTYVGMVTGSGTGNVTLTKASTGYVTNDILILFVESSNEAVSTPTGFTLINSQGSSANGRPTAIYAFYRRAVVGESADVTVTDPGDHALCALTAWRGAPRHIDPPLAFITRGTDSSPANNDIELTGSTTRNNSTVVIAATCSDVMASPPNHITYYQSSNLDETSGAPVEIDTDIQTSSGNDGAMSLAYGRKNTAGALTNLRGFEDELHLTTFGGPITWLMIELYPYDQSLEVPTGTGTLPEWKQTLGPNVR